MTARLPIAISGAALVAAARATRNLVTVLHKTVNSRGIAPYL